MISTIIDLLKYFTSSETRDTVRSISQFASSLQSDWKKHIYVAKADFYNANWGTIDAFSNNLFDMILDTGISEEMYERFEDVYIELINNSYNHGILVKNNYKCRVKCIFSRWFIQLEVSDNNKKFNFFEALDEVLLERNKNERKHISGLEMVYQLSDNLIVKNGKIIAIFVGEKRIKITKDLIRFQNRRVLRITILNPPNWSFLSPSWQPLRDAIDQEEQRFVLVRIGHSFRELDEDDRMKNRLNRRVDTATMRAVSSVISHYSPQEHRWFAYLVDSVRIYNRLKDLEERNTKIFISENEALSWLTSIETE